MWLACCCLLFIVIVYFLCLVIIIALERLVSGLTGITVTEMQGKMLCSELVIEFVESVKLDVVSDIVIVIKIIQ